jgi:hypothetical protein
MYLQCSHILYAQDMNSAFWQPYCNVRWWLVEGASIIVITVPAMCITISLKPVIKIPAYNLVSHTPTSSSSSFHTIFCNLTSLTKEMLTDFACFLN